VEGIEKLAFSRKLYGSVKELSPALWVAKDNIAMLEPPDLDRVA